jgi:hypothetical protein
MGPGQRRRRGLGVGGSIPEAESLQCTPEAERQWWVDRFGDEWGSVKRITHLSPHTPTQPPPPTHTHPPTHPIDPQSLTPNLTHLTLHPYHVAIPPGAGAVPQGFLVTGFPSWGGTGGLHPRYTRSYTHAAHHSHTPYTSPTRLNGSPPAVTGTCVFRHRRRRRHRSRHDGAVAHPAQPPAASLFFSLEKQYR